MDRFDAMNVFVRVVEAGSLSAAARAIPMSLTSVSRHLSALETQFGMQLLRRTTRHIALTNEGRLFFERAKSILAELDEVGTLLSVGRNEPAGRLRIAAPTLLGRTVIARAGRFPPTNANGKIRAARTPPKTPCILAIAACFGRVSASCSRMRRYAGRAAASPSCALFPRMKGWRATRPFCSIHGQQAMAMHLTASRLSRLRSASHALFERFATQSTL